MTIRLSLVIPAYNEAKLLPRLLDSVDAARARYAAPMEVIVADNASTDTTAALAAARGCVVAPVAKRVIGAARNGGAAKARGELLCFIDADSVVHPESFNAIDAALSDPRIVAGATGVRLERWSTGIAVTYAMMVPIIWLLGIDTGIVFCRRADFEAIGGYDESYTFAEDVIFLLALRKLGRARRQRLTRLRPVKAIASTRKFDKHGEWHYFTILAKTAGGKAVRSEFARKYWYADRE